ncbi:MAG: hypothetical protein ACJAU4_000948 [Glaciecola sp.]
MKKTKPSLFKKLALATALSTALISTQASAIPLILDGGWQSFGFEEVGSSWSDNFTFTIASDAFFVVTDAFCVGDRFSFFVNGISAGNTSLPFFDGTCDGPTNTNDPDFAFASSDWSSGELLLGAGSYTITGTALDSPFGVGAAYAQLTSNSVGGPPITPDPVSAPATMLLVLGGLGALSLSRRKSK